MPRAADALETDIAAAVVRWIGDHGAEVWQEVYTGSKRCDIVARVGPELWAIEVKRYLSLDVIDQARWWYTRAAAHRVYVATGGRRRAPWLQDIGLGQLVVGHCDVADPVARVAHVAPLRRRITTALTRHLHDAQKDALLAGSAGGGYHTPFRATCRAAVSVVKQTPGLLLQEVVARIDHHYSAAKTARSCLARYIREGVIAELELRDGRVWPRAACVSDRRDRVGEAPDSGA